MKEFKFELNGIIFCFTKKEVKLLELWLQNETRWHVKTSLRQVLAIIKNEDEKEG